jgi:hypothetical protein
VLVRPVQRSVRKTLEKAANYQGRQASASRWFLTMLLHCYLLSLRLPKPWPWPAQLRIQQIEPLRD